MFNSTKPKDASKLADSPDVVQDKKTPNELDVLIKKADHVYIGYFSGTEKEVRASVMEFIQSYVRDNELSRSKIYYNIETVTKHPYFEDGFVFEIHEGGDALSYLSIVMSTFAEKTKIQTIPLTNERSISLQKKPGNIDAYLNADEDMAGDVNFIDIQNRSKKIKRLFKDSYVFYYISLVSFVLAAFSLAFAMLFKFVIYNETKVYETESNTDFVIDMPVESLSNTTSTDRRRLTSVQYTKRKGWHKTFESRSFDTSEIEKSEVRVDKNGKETVSKTVSKSAVKGNTNGK